MSKESMSVNVTMEMSFTNDRIKDLICSGMEGGIAYWARISEYVDPPEAPDLNKLFTRSGSKLYKHNQYPLIPDAAVILEDAETGEGPWRFDLDAVKKGLQVMSQKYPKHFADFMEENEDADTGDAFIQCCLFGETVYG